jgi:hypothetical protein
VDYPAGDGGAGGSGGDAGAGGASVGGGLYGGAGSVLTLSNSTISGNTANPGKAGKAGAAGKGGGGYTDGAPGAPGTAADDGACKGGGVASYAGELHVSQLTIAKNAAVNGGGISLDQDTIAEIKNSTIASNKAALSGGGIFGVLDANNDPISIVSTIIALNTAKTNPDADATFNADHDLIQNIAGITFGSDISNLKGVDPKLGPLAVSKGATLATMLLVKGSPALDAGLNPDSLTTDERGGTAFKRLLGAGVDIGAVEAG